MKKLVIASLALAAFAAPAFAADMPVKAPVYKAPVIAPVYNWTGFYLGLNAGGSWGRQDNDLVAAATGVVGFANSDHLNGFIGGGSSASKPISRDRPRRPMDLSFSLPVAPFSLSPD